MSKNTSCPSILEVQRRITRTRKAMKQLTCCSLEMKGLKRADFIERRVPKNKKIKKITGGPDVVSMDWLFRFFYKNQWPSNKASRNKTALHANGNKPVHSLPKDIDDRNLQRPGERQGEKNNMEEQTLNTQTTSSLGDAQQLKIIRGWENISADNFTEFTVFFIFFRHSGVAFVGEQKLQ